MLRIALPLFVFACAHPVAPAVPSGGPAYPEAHRGEVVDDYHGTVVADPYRWLEDPDAAESRAWIEAQNALTHGWIDDVSTRDGIHARMTQIWNFERFGTPTFKAGAYYYQRNDGLQDHSVLHKTTDLAQPGEVLLDPNGFSEDGTISLAGTAVSEDGRYLAYGTSDGGSDWRVWQVLDMESGTLLEDRLEWVKFSDISWTHDSAGFFYSRYPAPENPLEAVNEHQKLYYHRLGTPQSDDPLIHEDPDHPSWGFGGTVTEDGGTLLIYVWEGTENKNRLYTKDLADPKAELVKLLHDYDASYTVLHKIGTKLWLNTNLDAPKGRVIAIDMASPARDHWESIIPETDEVLDGIQFTGGKFHAIYLKDARSVVRTFGLDGTPMGDIALPGIGSAWGFGGRSDAVETFYGFTGFTSPTTLYRLDLTTGESTTFKSPDVDFDPEAFETKQVFYESKDGTQVPMFITHKKGIELDGTNPTLLYGYGGFNISLTPHFSISRLVWMEMGGIYAVANLRGGGEYGEDWHHAGTLANKQNVFDDFAAAGEWLISNGYTQPKKLAINGGSNGGLLVGASITQRPDLFGAAIPAVGVLDMLRYHNFTIGWAWASDYGRSDDAEMFPHLLAYSPLHNVEAGTCYPPTMITTGDHDDRVVPAHSFKFAAELQDKQGCDNPILIRIETRAGHGAGKSTSMRIDELADSYAFLVRALDMDVSLSTAEAAAAK